MRGLFDVFRTNARPPSPAPKTTPAAPEHVAGGQLWRAHVHVCDRPSGVEVGLGKGDSGSIWKCKCGQRHRWVGNSWITAGAFLSDDGDAHLKDEDDDADE